MGAEVEDGVEEGKGLLPGVATSIADAREGIDDRFSSVTTAFGMGAVENCLQVEETLWQGEIGDSTFWLFVSGFNG